MLLTSSRRALYEYEPSTGPFYCGAPLDFDSFYETRQYNPADEAITGPILVITTDGKGVVMHEQDFREQTRKAAQK